MIECLRSTFLSLGVDDWQEKLVCLCMDGAAVNMGVRRGVAVNMGVRRGVAVNMGVRRGVAVNMGVRRGVAVNMGVRRGVAALLRSEHAMPWLVAVHCSNHRLELAAKDAFGKTYLEDISTMLINIYYVYTKSPKRLRDLHSVAEEMEEHIIKPQKAHGTLWLQHKKKAVKALISCYPVIVQHFRNLAEDNTADSARFRGYLKQLTSFKFVCNLVAFDVLLTRLAALSINLQCSSVDLQFALSSLSACRAMIQRMRTENALEEQTQLHTFLADVEEFLDADNDGGDDRLTAACTSRV